MRNALLWLALFIADLAGEPLRRTDPLTTLQPRIVVRNGLAYVVFSKDSA
jgi:hypothetical protein